MVFWGQKTRGVVGRYNRVGLTLYHLSGEKGHIQIILLELYNTLITYSPLYEQNVLYFNMKGKISNKIQEWL